MEDIIDTDYAQAKRLGEYQDLYVQGDTLLLTDAFEL